jgi:hypothetical protein
MTQQLLPATSISMASCRSGIASSLYVALTLPGRSMAVSTECQVLPMTMHHKPAVHMRKRSSHVPALAILNDNGSRSKALSSTDFLSESKAHDQATFLCTTYHGIALFSTGVCDFYDSTDSDERPTCCLVAILDVATSIPTSTNSFPPARPPRCFLATTQQRCCHHTSQA